MQTASTRIWTQIVDSIYYADNCYAKYAYKICRQWKNNYK